MLPWYVGTLIWCATILAGWAAGWEARGIRERKLRSRERARLRSLLKAQAAAVGPRDGQAATPAGGRHRARITKADMSRRRVQKPE